MSLETERTLESGKEPAPQPPARDDSDDKIYQLRGPES
jgi:hypothetical protein